MKASRNLYIQRYNQSNCTEFKREKYKFPKEFEILYIQTFHYDKTIYILQKQRWFLKPTTIGYAIISNTGNMLQEQKELFAEASGVHSETFINHDGCYIEDFMIASRHRRQGYATYFFKLLRQQFYHDYDLLLRADGDGVNFWDKVGFINTDVLTSTMTLKANQTFH